MLIDPYLAAMTKQKASDLYLLAGSPAYLKLEGELSPVDQNILEGHTIQKIANEVMNEEQRQTFQKTLEANLGITDAEKNRFRVNIYQERNETAMVIRRIEMKIPTIASLHLPEILNQLAMEKRGLILMVGATGSGKSTTLAAIIDYRNENSAGHIIAIEDPIEFSHTHKRSIISQREVGIDTLSYSNALKNSLREAPDVILIGEVRTKKNMEYAITFSETGHLCLSTLHANNANQALDRIINFFPQDRHPQLLLDLSLNLKAIISQRLIPGIDGKRVAAIEIMLNTPFIAKLIQEGKIAEIKEAMEKSESSGMQTFDQSLFVLFEKGLISEENAIHYADSQNNVRLKIATVKEKKEDLSLSLKKEN